MKKTLIALIIVSLSATAFAPPDPVTPPVFSAGDRVSAVEMPSDRKTTTEENRRDAMTAKPKLRAAPAVKEAPEPFGPQEWVVELAGTYSVAQPGGLRKVLKTSPMGGDFGASLGVTKFFTRNLGVGLEAGVNDAENIESVDYANVFVVLRTPLDSLLPSFGIARNIAPYATVGVGNDFRTGKQTGFVGGGVEYRISARFGIYIGSYYSFAEQDNRDASVTRLGLRIAL